MLPMALRDEFEMTGARLFRMRSWFPVPVILLVLLALRADATAAFETTHWKWELVCLAVGLVGVAIRCVAVGFAGRGTSGRSTRSPRADSLNTTGMYSVVRHPLYLGNYFMWLGPALLPRSWQVAIIVTFIFWMYYERIMFAEEAFLRRTFGETFEKWAARTPAVIPDFRLWVKPLREFSTATVMRREVWGIIGLVTTIAVLELASDVVQHGRVDVDPLWAGLAVPALVGGGVLHLVKKVRRMTSGRALQMAPPE
jgi:protein-S-isoprenylcysteine O-methyltransferase Ste14